MLPLLVLLLYWRWVLLLLLFQCFITVWQNGIVLKQRHNKNVCQATEALWHPSLLRPTLVDLKQGRHDCSTTFAPPHHQATCLAANNDTNNWTTEQLTANQNVAQSSLTTFSSQLSCQGAQHISVDRRREREQDKTEKDKETWRDREPESRRFCLRFA